MNMLTRCNHCNLAAIRERHGNEHVVLRLPRHVKRDWRQWTARPSQPDDPWIEVYVDGERVAAFLVLTERCVCGD